MSWHLQTWLILSLQRLPSLSVPLLQSYYLKKVFMHAASTICNPVHLLTHSRLNSATLPPQPSTWKNCFGWGPWWSSDSQNLWTFFRPLSRVTCHQHFLHFLHFFIVTLRSFCILPALITVFALLFFFSLCPTFQCYISPRFYAGPISPCFLNSPHRHSLLFLNFKYLSWTAPLRLRSPAHAYHWTSDNTPTKWNEKHEKLLQ